MFPEPLYQCIYTSRTSFHQKHQNNKEHQIFYAITSHNHLTLSTTTQPYRETNRYSTLHNHISNNVSLPTIHSGVRSHLPPVRRIRPPGLPQPRPRVPKRPVLHPKFDVKETKESYELHGELPGVQQKDINIEWTDNNTLTISGRHEHVREEGQRPQGFIENGENSDQKKIGHQPTVEDDPSESNTKVAKQSDKKEVSKQDESGKAKYWVSERSVGEFHRSFAFPARVDQDAVKASLKDGILSIVVPKAQAPQTRKINIE
ncbi:hypothetical protein CFE70_005618 [Pyrenophora teres f. teres 0-1]|nr:hypothetical protein P3342_001805 [Pyrenophora teres f. teres]